MVQLDELIKNEEEIRIIEYFIDNPAKEITQQEIRQKLKLAKGTIIKWLDFLVKNEVVTFKSIGLNKIYSLKNSSIFVRQLKITSILLKLLDLTKLNNDSEIYLYGSYARGEYSEDSDIDLLIIGKTTKNEIISLVDPLSKKLGKKISFQIFSSLEWSKMARKDPSFYERVEKDKIRLK